MSRVEFHPLADEELTATALFYESRAPGLGADFLDEAERVANGLAELPVLRFGVVSGAWRCGGFLTACSIG